jgi:hypothetical protein
VCATSQATAARFGHYALVALLTFVEVCAALASPFVFVWLLVSGGAETLAARIPRLGRSRSSTSLSIGLVKLGTALLLVPPPFIAADLAERSNSWVDADGNGFLDPWSNGSYDWWDINRGDCLRYWGALNIAVLGASAVLVYALGQRGSKRPQRSEVNT